MNNYHNYYILYLTKEKEDEKKKSYFIKLYCALLVKEYSRSGCGRVFKDRWKSSKKNSCKKLGERSLSKQ